MLPDHRPDFNLKAVEAQILVGHAVPFEWGDLTSSQVWHINCTGELSLIHLNIT